MEKGEQSRVAVKAEIKKKKKASASKKAKRKYRTLAESKEDEDSTITPDTLDSEDKINSQRAQ